MDTRGFLILLAYTLCIKGSVKGVEMESEFVKGLASNGPWAVMAGFLLHQVLKAWMQDRQSRDTVLVEFRATLDGLKDAVRELALEQKSLRQMFEELKRG